MWSTIEALEQHELTSLAGDENFEIVKDFKDIRTDAKITTKK
ncbi:MAG: hypothetical protein R2877_02335 [Bdellovibrionota bacterium]